MTSSAMRPDPKRFLPRLRGDVPFALFLLLLGALALAFWLADPSHRPGGGSRAEWPDQSSASR